MDEATMRRLRAGDTVRLVYNDEEHEVHTVTKDGLLFQSTGSHGLSFNFYPWATAHRLKDAVNVFPPKWWTEELKGIYAVFVEGAAHDGPVEMHIDRNDEGKVIGLSLLEPNSPEVVFRLWLQTAAYFRDSMKQWTESRNMEQP